MQSLVSNSKGLTGVYRGVIIDGVFGSGSSSDAKSARVYIPALHKGQMPFKTAEDGTIEGCLFETTSQTVQSAVTGDTTTNTTGTDASGEETDPDNPESGEGEEGEEGEDTPETGDTTSTTTTTENSSSEGSQTVDITDVENQTSDIVTTSTSDTSTASATTEDDLPIQMRKADYPEAQICSWSVCPEVKTGEPVWVMFENGDAEHPVIIGDLGSVLPDISTLFFSGGSGVGIRSVNIPEGLGTTITYMGQHMITNTSSTQYQILADAKSSGRYKRGEIYGINNMAIVDGRMGIALVENVGGQLGNKVGDYIDAYFADGDVWKCIQLDAKHQGAPVSYDPNPANMWGHQDGKVVLEIVSHNYSPPPTYNTQKKLTRLVLVGNYYTGMFSASSGTASITIDGNTVYYNGLIRCINGTDQGYESDEGLDIGAPIGTPVYAPCNCTIRYSEHGHTPWTGPNDTAYSIGLYMDQPVQWAGKNIEYIFLTHLSRLVYNVPNGSGGQRVVTGQLLAYSGTANSSPHLHIGLSPRSWSPLRNNQVRDFFASTYGQQWVVGK